MFIMDNEVNLVTDTKQPNSNVLQFLSRHTIRLNLSFILVENKTLSIGCVYLKLENWLKNSGPESMRLVDFWEHEQILYLKMQNIDNLEMTFLNWNLNLTGDYWLWSLADFNYLQRMH